jgi:hypothetical protein
MLAPVPGSVIIVDRLAFGIPLRSPTSRLRSMYDWALTEFKSQVACANTLLAVQMQDWVVLHWHTASLLTCNSMASAWSLPTVCSICGRAWSPLDASEPWDLVSHALIRSAAAVGLTTCLAVHASNHADSAFTNTMNNHQSGLPPSDRSCGSSSIWGTKVKEIRQPDHPISEANGARVGDVRH